MVPWLLSLSHGYVPPMGIVSKYCTYEIAPLGDPRRKLKSSDDYYCIWSVVGLEATVKFSVVSTQSKLSDFELCSKIKYLYWNLFCTFVSGQLYTSLCMKSFCYIPDFNFGLHIFYLNMRLLVCSLIMNAYACMHFCLKRNLINCLCMWFMSRCIICSESFVRTVTALYNNCIVIHPEM